MADYKDLATLYHIDSSSQREKNIRKILLERRNSDSSFGLNFAIDGNELFLAVPRELSNLTQKVLRRERKVSKLMQALPGIAQNEVLRGLVIDEVVMSNTIENIHSTRKQIEEVLADTSTDDVNLKRFKEFARLYLELSDGSFTRPETVEDIRSIYDRVMFNEGETDRPDGKLFRKDSAVVTDGLKQVHVGLVPEAKIIEALQDMLDLVNSAEVPEFYSALASHFIFEYIHPFYDGNGRTGRYLLAVYLEAVLSKPTVLSLSRVIAEHKDSYYRAFNNVENPLNYGELTFFVMTLLELILTAQDELIDRLEKNAERFNQLREKVDELRDSKDYSEKEISLIFGLAQQSIFGFEPSLSKEALAGYIGLGAQQARKYLSEMEKRGIVKITHQRRPLAFALSDDFSATLFQ